MNFRQKWMMLECNYVLWNILDTYTLKKYLLFFWKSNLTKLLYFIWQLHLVPFTEFILYLLICNIILLFFRFMDSSIFSILLQYLYLLKPPDYILIRIVDQYLQIYVEPQYSKIGHFCLIPNFSRTASGDSSLVTGRLLGWNI